MAIQGKIIKQKIRSVANIRKITKTMEMVSVSKMRKATIRTLGSRTYAILGLKLIAYLRGAGENPHPLTVINPKAKEKILVVIYGGNKGLCGGFHVNILKTMLAFMKVEQLPIEVVTVGKYAEKIANKLKLPIIASYIEWNEQSKSEDLEILSRLAQKQFLEGEYKEVYICYTEFVKSTTYKPMISRVLPASNEVFESLARSAGNNESNETNTVYDFGNYLFEPSKNEVENIIIPGMVTVAFYQALAESHASEHSARMFAMKNAGDNATSLLEDLQLTYNNARQSGITQEISEIVGGASALQVD